MITREQVADLQPGDVVELVRQGWPEGTTLRGPLIFDSCRGDLWLGDLAIRDSEGKSPTWATFRGSTLTVISRAPRPLYVNHPRTYPVDGDIARDRDGDACQRSSGHWYMAGSTLRRKGLGDYAPLTLLWDGETGQVSK